MKEKSEKGYVVLFPEYGETLDVAAENLARPKSTSGVCMCTRALLCLVMACVMEFCDASLSLVNI